MVADHGVVVDRAPRRAVVADRLGRPARRRWAGLDPARMVQFGGEHIDLEAGRGGRQLPGRPALRGRHLERRDRALRLGGRDRRITAQGRRDLSPVLSPHDDSHGPDQLDHPRKSVRHTHGDYLSKSCRARDDKGRPCPHSRRSGETRSRAVIDRNPPIHEPIAANTT